MILALNAGSSTLKFAVFGDGNGKDRMVCLVRGEVAGSFGGDGRGGDRAHLRVRLPAADRSLPEQEVTASHQKDAVALVLRTLESPEVTAALGARQVVAIGHRVVHGGARFVAPVVVTPQVRRDLDQVTELAPLHNPLALQVIDAALGHWPGRRNVAVFDTAFHATLPEVAYRYALPRELADRLGLRRYGFHGLSHQYVSQRLLALLGRKPAGTRLITCHLGSGASLAAIRDGRSIDTSMGLTPLGGLVMGTRPGDLDPGVAIRLQRSGLDAAGLDDLLEHRSGLYGLTGRSSVQELELAAADAADAAAFALELFAYRVRFYLGAYAAILGGLDGVAFAGGIGEHDAAMRARICAGLDGRSGMNIHLDPERNRQARGEARISPDPAGPDGRDRVPVWVVPTDEERVIARAAASTDGGIMPGEEEFTDAQAADPT